MIKMEIKSDSQLVVKHIQMKYDTRDDHGSISRPSNYLDEEDRRMEN